MSDDLFNTGAPVDGLLTFNDSRNALHRRNIQPVSASLWSVSLFTLPALGFSVKLPYINMQSCSHSACLVIPSFTMHALFSVHYSEFKRVHVNYLHLSEYPVLSRTRGWLYRLRRDPLVPGPRATGWRYSVWASCGRLGSGLCLCWAASWESIVAWEVWCWSALPHPKNSRCTEGTTWEDGWMHLHKHTCTCIVKTTNSTQHIAHK